MTRPCERFELLAGLVIDEEATLEERAELARHLETCPDCRAYFEDIRRIHGTFAQEEIVVPEGFSARLMDRVRETKQDQPQEEKKTILFPRWKRWAALAACCAVAVLSVWAVRGAGGVKDAMVTMDDAPRALMDAQPADGLSATQESESDADEDAGTGGEVTNEAAPSIPDEYTELAKSVAKEGAGEGDYKPLADDQFAPEPALSAAMPPDTSSVPGDSEPMRQDGPAEGIEAVPAKEDTLDDAEPILPAGSPMDAPANAEPEEEPEPEPEEDAPAPEPAEVIGVPEPGILIAKGRAARAWVENTLGLEWALGGSYPLTAEQYGDLTRTLDEAGETYQIEPGEGYCLMTE